MLAATETQEQYRPVADELPGAGRHLAVRRGAQPAAVRAEVEGFYGHDPLLTTLAGLRRQRHGLDAAIRRLLAYGRQFTRPHPYRLADLADAAGMSISGVRTAYDADEIEQVARATGLTLSPGQQPAKLWTEPSP